MLNIAVLSKRQYMHKDLITDRYGRFWEIPQALAQKDHDVCGYALSYTSLSEGRVDARDDELVQWSSYNAGKTAALGLWRYMKKVSADWVEQKPDVIWACSDSLYIIVGSWFAKKYGIKLVADLYDNFEAYASADLPFVKSLYHRALAQADLISVVSDRLRQKIVADVSPHAEVITLENGIPANVFRPLNKQACRRQHSIPLDVPVIGSTGVMSYKRGVRFLFDAFQMLKKDIPNLHLVLAGARDSDVELPQDDNVIDCGVVAQTDLPSILATLDLAIINNNQTPFSEYTYPQRLAETLSCHVPVLASRVGAVQDVLSDYPQSLYEVESLDDFVIKAKYLLSNPDLPSIEMRSWADLASRLEEKMNGILSVD